LFDTHRFDPAFGLTGGEDTDLFARLIDAGATFLWCDEAKVYEHVPRARQRLSWLFVRHVRGGLGHTLIENRRRSWLHRVRGLAKALAGLVLFAGMVPFDLLRGPTFAARRLLRIATQCGHVLGAFNIRHHGYRVKQ
jgi:hypothetical protein